jgi:endonuclease/exonuclease/phosphatase family metal-dependent hydrolase
MSFLWIRNRILIFIFVFFSFPVFSAQLKFMTFNAAFLPFVSKKFNSRKLHFAEEVSKMNPDIIALQEVWMPKTRRDLVADFKKVGYPFFGWVKSGSFFPRGFMGHGLLVVSKYPISGEVKFRRFKNYTRPEEYLARKGILKVPVMVPGLGILNIYNTHLGAVSFSGIRSDFDASNLADNGEQLDQVVEFIQQEQGLDRSFILAGDFNFHPTPWRRALNNYDTVEFRDAYFRVRDGLDVEDVFPMSTAVNNPESWLTFDPARNPIIRKLTDPRAEGIDPRSRFDYIWYPADSALELLGAAVVMDDRKGKILSDHFAIESVFQFEEIDE